MIENRTGPRYSSGSTGPKDVVIVIDVSGSMSTAGRSAKARAAAHNLIETLEWKEQLQPNESKTEINKTFFFFVFFLDVFWRSLFSFVFMVSIVAGYILFLVYLVFFLNAFASVCCWVFLSGVFLPTTCELTSAGMRSVPREMLLVAAPNRS